MKSLRDLTTWHMIGRTPTVSGRNRGWVVRFASRSIPPSSLAALGKRQLFGGPRSQECECAFRLQRMGVLNSNRV